jgi:hypothetical protein
MRRLYEVLGVSEDAPPEDIERAYKRLASRYHPDKNIGNEAAASELFKEMKEAYECLIDPERRQQYDETGDSSLKNENPAEDLFFHLLNEITEHVESACEIIQKLRLVLEQMMESTLDRKFEVERKITVARSMWTSVRYRGKRSNVIAGILEAKIQKLQGERALLEAAEKAAGEAYRMIDDYEALDRPSPRSEEDTGESIVLKAVEGMLRDSFEGRANQAFRRRGGMPFSGV